MAGGCGGAQHQSAGDTLTREEEIRQRPAGKELSPVNPKVRLMWSFFPACLREYSARYALKSDILIDIRGRRSCFGSIALNIFLSCCPCRPSAQSTTLSMRRAMIARVPISVHRQIRPAQQNVRPMVKSAWSMRGWSAGRGGPRCPSALMGYDGVQSFQRP
jgi:hypothetical protein